VVLRQNSGGQVVLRQNSGGRRRVDDDACLCLVMVCQSLTESRRHCHPHYLVDLHGGLHEVAPTVRQDPVAVVRLFSRGVVCNAGSLCKLVAAIPGGCKGRVVDRW
jgi:hypothetical protein